VYESINAWHVKEPGEASGICILHYPSKY
jgi:hypothetical protein